MQPMHPLDTRTPDQEYEYVESYKSGSTWAALLVALVVALLIGAVLLLGSVGGSESNEVPVPTNEVPVPTEAPLDPGA